MIELDTIYCMDCFDLMAQCDDHSVDMILADLPYGTTACAWDTVIPFEPMWTAFKRVIKPRGAIVLTASQPFTSALVMSNPAWFRYEWIWHKPMATGFLNAPHRPLRAHENILVFFENNGVYNPQMGEGKPYIATTGIKPRDTIHDKNIAGVVTHNPGNRFPRSVIEFNNDTGLHPTQKSLELFSYLVRTYTRPGELVLDPTCGSGTTCLAARNEGRRYIGGDTDPGYVDIARQRLAAPYTLPLFSDEPAEDTPPTQNALFRFDGEPK